MLHSSASPLLLVTVLAAYGVMLWRMWRRPRRLGDAALAATAFWVVFLLLVVGTPWFRPWYLIWLVPLAALLPTSRLALIAAVFSASVMAMYLPMLWLWYVTGDGLALQAVSVAVGFLPPVLVALDPYLARLRAWTPALAPAPD